MGILNITPDSFYDGALYDTPEKAVEHARILIENGADVLDIGAESTRPGSVPVAPETERDKLSTVLRRIRLELPDVMVSIDTRNASSAAAMLNMGADIINDVSACRYDPELKDVLAQYRPAYILMHAQGTPDTMQVAPHYDNVVDEVKAFFEKNLARLVTAGLPEDHIALDPGIGFGKTLEHNLSLLANIHKFLIFGRPLVGAISMKSMFGKLLGLPADRRGEETAVASALLWSRGVFWHRAHNVSQVRNALLVAKALSCQ